MHPIILFEAKKKKKSLKNSKIDYAALYEYIQGMDFFTPQDIKNFIGVKNNSVQGIITGLSLLYPVYELSYGKYAILKIDR